MMYFVFLLLLFHSTAYSKEYDSYPFMNISLSFKDRVKDLVDRLELDELVQQMAHGGASRNGPAPAIIRLGIHPYQWGTECLSGDVGAGPATSFPMSIGMAASMDYDMLYATVRATSDEVRAKNNDAVSKNSYAFHTGLSCWSPVLNIMRDPRWGRNQETYGEDPWLSGYLAKAFVTGLQGNHPRYIEANAGCKHFDVHGGPENIPVSRFSFDAKVTMRDWRMTFLPQFKACAEAGTYSFMCSYNSINGVPACANKLLLTNITRNEWGFEGYIVSDQGALENVVKAHHYSKDYVHAAADIANAGTCLEDGNAMDKSGNVFSNLDDAVNQNLVTMDTLKDAVSRLFLVRMKLGEFDPPDMNPYTSLSMSLIQSDKHQQIALQAAMKTIVLLKNDGKLPLGNDINKACAIGPFIDDTELLFGDYSPNDAGSYTITPYVGIKNYTSIGRSTLNKAVGCSDGPSCKKYSSSDIKTACNGMDIVIATAGLSRHLESEGNDRADIEFPGDQLQLLKDTEMASGNAPIILILFNANPLDISYAKTNDRFSAILEAYYPGQTAGEAIANVLTGKYNPAGRLPNTWPMSLDQVPDMTNYTMEGRTYRYSTAEPLYPFGYGLSYTTFKYTDINVSPDTAKAGTNITVSFTVTNIGKMDGDEVSQVYIEWIDATDPVPIKQLVGVSRNFIKQNENKQLSFTITGDQMKIWVDNWVIPTGQYGVSAGGQQPGQQTTVPSNILTGAFKII